MKDLLVAAFLTLARRIAADAAERIAELAERAQRELRELPGPEKKAWLMAEIKKTREWMTSGLYRLPTFISSAVVDGVIAWAKNKR